MDDICLCSFDKNVIPYCFQFLVKGGTKKINNTILIFVSSFPFLFPFSDKYKSSQKHSCSCCLMENGTLQYKIYEILNGTEII